MPHFRDLNDLTRAYGLRMGRSVGGSFESKVPGWRYVSYQSNLKLKQVPTAKCWSAQVVSDRRITFNESLLPSHWPGGGTWSRWDEGGCSVWNFLPTQTEAAAAARPSIYSRLIAELHVTSQVVAPESVVGHPRVYNTLIHHGTGAEEYRH